MPQRTEAELASLQAEQAAAAKRLRRLRRFNLGLVVAALGMPPAAILAAAVGMRFNWPVFAMAIVAFTSVGVILGPWRRWEASRVRDLTAAVEQAASDKERLASRD